MNRVEKLYEIAVIYMGFEFFGRFLLASHFNVATDTAFDIPEDQFNEIVFKTIVDRNLYEEFGNLAKSYKSGALAHDLSTHRA